MRALLVAALVLIPTVPALAGSVITSCQQERTDESAVAVDNVPRTRVSHQAADGWFYVTASPEANGNAHWRETNAFPGLQVGSRMCFDYWVEGTTWDEIRRYFQYVADTVVEEPEQAVP